MPKKRRKPKGGCPEGEVWTESFGCIEPIGPEDGITAAELDDRLWAELLKEDEEKKAAKRKKSPFSKPK